MQQGGGGGGSHSHHFTLSGGGDQSGQKHQMVVEEASPISSRPPATDEFGFPTMDALARAAAEGDDPDHGGGSSGGGNRWPRQETLALLKIRSEMDTAFRDATVKGPLWEDVSRKMAELGYRRNAKKCREKFENVDKYYKRTKEGRGGRQDGKSYKFFTELEALHNTSTSAAAPQPPPFTVVAPPPPPSNVTGTGFSSPMPISLVRPVQPHFTAAGAPPSSSPVGLEFSSNSSSSSPETEDDDLDNEGTDLDGEPSNTAGSSRKRKRGSSGGNSRRMMEFFQGLMTQVMQKQETMQQKFLEAIERREQERIMREEAWRRQEMARLAQEHEIMARERAVAASRDASILSFLQKVTGQAVQLPTPVATAAVVAPPTPIPAPPVSSQPITPLPYQQPHQHRQSEIALAAVPEQQLRIHDVGSEPPSSRWPKTEVLALIRVRSGLEPRYQEAGPKGPLWEEISATMQRMGYKRSAKRCKEKWENINKYFKKVKESNKKRPEDAKTCPYFHELDTLYRNKVLGSGSGSEGGSQLRIEAPVVGGSQEVQHQTKPETTTAEAKDGGDSGDTGAKQPEDTVKERRLDLHDESEGRQSQQLNVSELRNENSNGGGLQLGRGSGNADEEDEAMDDYDEEDDDDEEDEDEDEDLDEERKMEYKIEFQQRHNEAAGPRNGGGNGAATSFLAMVQ